MLRKATLIAAGTFSGAPVTQSILYTVINTSFFILLYILKPLVFFPCSIFKGKNLFQLAEMSGCAITIIGNLLALVGSFSQAAVNGVGITFAVINFCFAIFFGYGYGRDMKRTVSEKKVKPEGETRSNTEADNNPISRRRSRCLCLGSRSDSVKATVGKAVEDAVKEWENVLRMISNADGEAEAKLNEGLPFIHRYGGLGGAEEDSGRGLTV